MAQGVARRTMYQHRPFENPDSLRLLHLLPGAFADNIHVELTEVSLNKPPSYEALSYVWGSPAAEDPISCHGELLLVTANCVAAMRRLRHKKKRRILWIDAICINQGALDERNHQVGLMGDIYSKAKKVIIWLGEAFTCFDFAMSFLNDYHRILTKKWLGQFRHRLLENKIREFKRMEKRSIQDGLEFVDVLRSICNSPWFTRKWAVQEYVLSQDSYFQCGGKLLHASKLFTAIKELDARFARKSISNSLILPYSFWAYLECFSKIKRNLKGEEKNDRTRKFSSLDIVAIGRAQIATNPKDAVFGLYGLLQRLNILVPPPDYSQSVEQIYTEAARTVIMHDNSLHLLRQSCECKDLPNLPSWVPDWNVTMKHGLVDESLPSNSNFAMSKGSTTKFAFFNGGQSISVRGCFVDTIARTAKNYIPLPEDLVDFPEFQPEPESKVPWQEIVKVEAYQEWINIAHSLATYPYGETARQSFRQILVPENSRIMSLKQVLPDGFDAWLRSYPPTNRVLTETQPNPSNSSMERVYVETSSKSMRQKESNTIEGQKEKKLDHYGILKRIFRNQHAADFALITYSHCKRTRFFTTSAGYMGKGLRAIQERDLVALISRVDMPMIIRKEGDLYRLKGPAYIHGIMKGEKWPEDERGLIDIILS